MWFQKNKKFLYFFFTPTMCINNNNKQKLFTQSFNVGQLDKENWASNGNSQVLAPEILTYWSE